MKVVEIEKGKISGIISFLSELPLNRRKSRMRRQLISVLKDKEKDFLKEREEIAKEHSEKDENEEPIINDNQYSIKNQIDFLEDVGELNKEIIFIEGGDNQKMIKEMKPILKKFEEEEYGGEESEVYDYLCDQFGVDEDEESNHEESDVKEGKE